MRISIIVAMTPQRVIGKGGDMPWHLPAELQHFKGITMGRPIVMGRRTHESIGRPLPGRQHIVVTRERGYESEGVHVVHSLDQAIAAAGDAPELMIIGGATLYRQALDRAGRVYLTLVHASLEGDTWFPELDPAQWDEVERTERQADERNPYPMTFLTLDRKPLPDSD
jgi:dihydrofolate reductase